MNLKNLLALTGILLAIAGGTVAYNHLQSQGDQGGCCAAKPSCCDSEATLVNAETGDCCPEGACFDASDAPSCCKANSAAKVSAQAGGCHGCGDCCEPGSACCDTGECCDIGECGSTTTNAKVSTKAPCCEALPVSTQAKKSCCDATSKTAAVTAQK